MILIRADKNYLIFYTASDLRVISKSKLSVISVSSVANKDPGDFQGSANFICLAEHYSQSLKGGQGQEGAHVHQVNGLTDMAGM